MRASILIAGFISHFLLANGQTTTTKVRAAKTSTAASSSSTTSGSPNLASTSSGSSSMSTTSSGASCLVNLDCQTKEFCSFPFECQGPGVCTAITTFCPMYCMVPKLPGCDGMSYCNPCVANAAGVSINNTMTINTTPVPVSTIPNLGGYSNITDLTSIPDAVYAAINGSNIYINPSDALTSAESQLVNGVNYVLDYSSGLSIGVYCPLTAIAVNATSNCTISWSAVQNVLPTEPTLVGGWQIIDPSKISDIRVNDTLIPFGFNTSLAIQAREQIVNGINYDFLFPKNETFEIYCPFNINGTCSVVNNGTSTNGTIGNGFFIQQYSGAARDTTTIGTSILLLLLLVLYY